LVRKRRVWLPQLYYHVTSRGNRKEPLFHDRKDYEAYFHILEEIHERTSFELASYCLMTNHFHLQMRSEHESISKVMSLINKRYATYYNSRYDLTGHVFEKRFYSEPIIDEKGLLDVSRYIHLNPVEAGLVKDPEKYPWSSYFFYKNPSSNPPSYLNHQPLLKKFSGSEHDQRKQYVAFVLEETPVSNDALERF